MKAILLKDFGGPEMLVAGDADMPAPRPGQVLIKVKAAAVNKPDVLQRTGNYPPPTSESDIIGLEVAGIIESTGSPDSPWEKGDKVMALLPGGGYAEFALAYDGHVMPVPDAMSFNEAACVCETYITAWLNLFLLGRLTDGESVLLHGGGGGVNTAAIQLCTQLPKDVQIFVTASPGKLERVGLLGADYVIDYQNEDFAEQIKVITGGKGVSVILDHIGAPYLKSNMKSLAVGGRLLQIGVSQGASAELNLALMMVKRQQIIGSVLRSRPIEEKAAIIKRFAEISLPMFAAKRMVPLISHALPLEQACEAHRIMEASQHFGKIVLEV